MHIKIGEVKYRFIDNKGTINVGTGWFEVELVFVADLCAVCFRRTTVVRASCKGSWELAAGKEQNWFESEFPEEPHGREGGKGGEAGGGGMICISLCA